MQLKDVMSRDVQVVQPDVSLAAAAAKMKLNDIGALPVCDGERLVGMLTDRDIVVRAIAEGRDPKKSPVREAMTPQIVYGFEEQDVREAAHLMEEKQLARLAVLNRAKRLVGIVSLGDLAAESGETEMPGGVLKKVKEDR